MSHLFSLLPADGWQRLLCDVLWQSTLIGALGLLAAQFFVRQSAARAWLLLVVLSACVLIPVASWAARQMQWTVLASATFPVPLSEDRAIAGDSPWRGESIHTTATGSANVPTIQDQELQSLEVSTIDDAAKPIAASPVSELASEAHMPADPPVEPGANGRMRMETTAAVFSMLWLGIIWLAASALLALRLVASTIATRRLLHRAKPSDDAQLLAAATVAAQRVGLSGIPRMSISPQVHTPMILALGRPQLLVPAAYGQNSQKIDWVAAFTHELAHAARHDGWARLWIELVTMLLPLAPLVWVLRHRFQIASEQACDDWAVASGTDPVDLADTLTAWMNPRRYSAALVAIGMSSSKARTLRLLSLHEKPCARLSRLWRWIGIPAALMLMVGLAVAQSPTNKPKTDAAKSNSPNKGAVQKSSAQTNSTPAGAKPETALPEYLVEKAIADDALILMYTQRLAEDRQDLADIEANKIDYSPDYKAKLPGEIKSFEDRIETRKAVVRAQLAEKLREDQAITATMAGPGRGGPAFVIEPGDVVVISQPELIPKRPSQISYFANIGIKVTGTKLEEPINGSFNVDSAGEVVLGPSYGAVKVAGLTRRDAEEAIKLQLEKTLMQPVVSVTMDENRWAEHLTHGLIVDAAGRILLGPYGKVMVAGLTETEAEAAIEKQLGNFFRDPKILVQINKPQKEPGNSINLNSADATLKQGSKELTDADHTLRQSSKELTDASARLSQGSKELADPDHTAVRNETESPYIIEPPDILLITPIRLVPRDAVRIQPGDKVIIDVEGAPYTEPIKGQFKVDSSGEVVLGPRYGSVKISGLKRREAQEAVKTQLQTVLKSPEVALTIDESRIEKGIDGQHLVGPDGTINLGTYGQVQVDHDTVQQATKAIEDKLKGFFLQAEVAIDIYAYNSKVFYVIVDGRAGSTIYRFPITGNETLLDAVAQVPGLTGLSESTIFIARPVPKAIDRSIPVNWNDALSGTKPGANPPILAGDRIFIQGAFREPGLGSGGSYKAPAWPPGEKPQNSHVISTPSPPNQ